MSQIWLGLNTSKMINEYVMVGLQLYFFNYRGYVIELVLKAQCYSWS